jgi:hypothetical protein
MNTESLRLILFYRCESVPIGGRNYSAGGFIYSRNFARNVS